MSRRESGDFIRRSRPRLVALLRDRGLMDAQLTVRVGMLSPEEAIGAPLRQDFPILRGRERMLEARFKGARGHAFTDTPREFKGSVGELLERPLEDNGDRALYLATLNAALRHLGEVDDTVHCRDEEPEQCAKEIARHIAEDRGAQRVGLIGCNPAIAEAVVTRFGPGNVRLTDLDPENIGGGKFGVEVWDGATRTRELVAFADLVLITGTTLVNDTFDGIWRDVCETGKDYLIYGVTAAGIAYFFGLNRICVYAR